MLIQCQGVGKCYKRGPRTFWALRGADFSLEKGEFVTLLGRSGSGKSTLLNILVGLLNPDEGRVSINETAVAGLDDRAVSALRNRVVGYVPQDAGLLGTLSVLDNVRLPWYLSDRGPEPEGRAMDLLKAVDLADLAEQYPSALSGGEARRVAIARALMTRPAAVVADEPTSSLDAESAANVVRIFRRLADQGTAVLMVTHDTSSLAVSDRIYDMTAGKLTARCESVD